jgi:MATE family multidrug resistance protein
VVALGALRGMKDTRVPLVMAVICYWPVGFGVAVGLGFWAGLGGVGVWLGLAVALTVVGVALSWRFHLNTRKLASA